MLMLLRWQMFIGGLFAATASFAMTLTQPLDGRNPYSVNAERLKACELNMGELCEPLTKLSEHPKKRRPRGEADPHYPARIELRPRAVPLVSTSAVANRPDILRCWDRGNLDLKCLRPHDLDQLAPSNLAGLLGQLRQLPLRLKWRDGAGRTRSGEKHFFNLLRLHKWEHSNAAAAVAMIAGAEHDKRLLTSILSLTPEAVLPTLDGDAASLLDEDVTARAAVAILQHMVPGNMSQTAVSLADIVAIYVEYWADGNADWQLFALSKLILQTQTVLRQEGINVSRKQVGIMLGAFLAGSLHYARKIRSADEKKIWLVNGISNLVWATTAFLGIVPIAGSVTAAVSGAIAVGAVAWAVIVTRHGARDFSVPVLKAEGHIKMAVLQAAEEKSIETKVEAFELLEWMSAAIHVNGFFD